MLALVPTGFLKLCFSLDFYIAHGYFKWMPSWNDGQYYQNYIKKTKYFQIIFFSKQVTV